MSLLIIKYRIFNFLFLYYRMTKYWFWYFIIFLLVTGGIRPLIAAFMVSQGYKCAEWTENLFGRRNCIKWTQ